MQWKKTGNMLDAEAKARKAADDAIEKKLPGVATSSTPGLVKASGSITVAEDGTANVNPEIFGDGLSTTDGKVSVDTGFVGEHLAGNALYYDSTDGLMVKTGAGLHIDNDTLSVDQDTLPLASASNRGTVIVGSGLSISNDGVLSVDASSDDCSCGIQTSTNGSSVLPTGISNAFLKTFYFEHYYFGTRVINICVSVIPKATFAMGTSFTIGFSISAKLFYSIVEYFKTNHKAIAVTRSGSSQYEINPDGFTVTVSSNPGIISFNVEMTSATLSTTQMLIIGAGC